MIGDEIFYNKLFENLFADTFELQLWNGSSKIYGDGNPKFKIIFNEPIPKADIIKDPSLAFGEGYMTKKIDIDGNIEDVIESLYKNKDSFLGNDKFSRLVKAVKNNLKNSRENIQYHYDIGNDFYKLWLDDTMTYSCGYFKSKDDSLTEAQINKVEHILKKLNLKEGETLLDIGCGWGTLIIAAAKIYKVKSTGITLSSAQYEKVKERIENEGLNDLVQVKLMDYREMKDEKFDKVVSVGMLEHVGKDHLCEYFSSVNHLLNDKGISLVHCITNTSDEGTNSWINKYIFPGGYVPSIQELVADMCKENFNIIDVENLRMHYAKTLECWYSNFKSSLSEIKKMKDETFIRMWALYLNACAASFKSGNINLHQFLFSKGVNNDIPWTREYMYK